MMRSTLLITNAYPDFDSSYRGIFIKKMAMLLQKGGYDITVLTPKIYRKSHYFEDQNGIRVYRFPFFAGNKLLIEYNRIPYLRMILYYLSGFFLTLYILFKHRCRLIHIHWAIPTGLIGLWASKFLRKPLIVTIHGSDLRMALEKGGVLRRVFISVCRNSSHIQCVSEVQKKELLPLGLPETKISVIPMGVDKAFYDSGEERRMERGNRPFTVISNRNLIPIYNISLLIRAIPMIIKEAPGTKFIIAGEGNEKEALEQEAKALNVYTHIEFLGRIPHEEMPSLLAKSDIYVSTSLYDGTSVSLLEAMGAGVFPIVTDIPANREWIEDGKNGFLFPVNDENILARRVLDAIRDKEKVEKVRKWNQSLVEKKILWSVCLEKVKKMYEDQLAKK
ncbi:MAG: glycosyltransferase family 4 protein [Deltaproteobacteria bacterium]|nr:glycosyltransferase family 4 protein [Deltaproteobacteria bacterium]